MAATATRAEQAGHIHEACGWPGCRLRRVRAAPTVMAAERLAIVNRRHAKWGKEPQLPAR